METITFRKDGRVATAVINRPEAANTINLQAKDELLRVIREVSLDDGIGVLVITGAGRVFCAGGDFRPGNVREGLSTKEAEDMQPSYDEVKKGKILPDVIQLQLELQRLDKPTIAMVNGAAVGHGCDVALSCDMRTGSPQSRFRGFARMGIAPPTGGTWLLPRIVGMGKALEFMFTGAWCGGEEAYRIGLLNRLVPAEQLEEETMNLAGEIAAGPPIAHRLAKFQAYKGLQMDFETALAFATTCGSIASATEDHQEGIKALAEKRAPEFRGR